MHRFVFDILSDPLGLPVNDLWEYGVLVAIGIIAFFIGWEASRRGVFCSVIHGAVSLLTFLILWAAAYALMAAVQWAIANLLLVCGVVAIAMAGVLTLSVARLCIL